MNINELISIIETQFNWADRALITIEEWQTLKAIVLAQQTNNKQSVPCKCERTYLAKNGFSKICLDCGKVQ